MLGCRAVVADVEVGRAALLATGASCSFRQIQSLPGVCRCGGDDVQFVWRSWSRWRLWSLVSLGGEERGRGQASPSANRTEVQSCDFVPSNTFAFTIVVAAATASSPRDPEQFKLSLWGRVSAQKQRSMLWSSCQESWAVNSSTPTARLSGD